MQNLMLKKYLAIAAVMSVIFSAYATWFSLAQSQPANSSPSPTSGTAVGKTGASEQELAEAQINYYKAQADYYQNQAKLKTFAQVVTSALPNMLGTIAGAAIALIGVWAQGIRQSRSEDKKWLREKKDETQKEARLAVSELIKKVAAGFHSMTWVLWIARFLPDHVTRKHISEHDTRLHAIYTKLVAAQSAVAALDESLYQKTKPLVDELYKYDARLALLAKDLRTSREKVPELGNLWKEVYDYSNELAERVRGMLGLGEIKT